MTVPATQGIFGFGLQSAKGATPSSWYRMQATRVDFGFQQGVEQFPPELGGILEPTGAFKSMAFGAGGAVMHPRLKDLVGLLFYAATGNASVVTHTGYAEHVFLPTTSFSSLPWLTVRRFIPGALVADSVGESIKDCRLQTIQIDVAPASLAQMTVAIVGREPTLDRNANSWSWANAYENPATVPLANQGSLMRGNPGGTPDTPVPATNVSVALTNGLTDVREEMIIGSPYPDDFVLQSQALTFRWTYKWQDRNLYESLLTGGDTSGIWSPQVYYSSFSLVLNSPGNIPSTSIPYQLEIYAPNVAWQAEGPPALIGGGFLTQNFIGTANNIDATPSFRIVLRNDRMTVYP